MAGSLCSCFFCSRFPPKSSTLLAELVRVSGPLPFPTDFVLLSRSCSQYWEKVGNAVKDTTHDERCLRPCDACMSNDFAYTEAGVLRDDVLDRDHDRVIVECTDNCPNPIPENRQLQRGTQFRLELFMTSDNRGWGLRSLDFIPRGAFVCEYVGELLPGNIADERENPSYNFALSDDADLVLDSRMRGNISRFINHRCRPNLSAFGVLTGDFFVSQLEHRRVPLPRVGFFSERDIPPGEELTIDYSWMLGCWAGATMRCRCGHKVCRRRLL